MKLLPIQSSMLAAVGYNPSTEKLVAVFNDGNVYAYSGVPSDTFVAVITDTESHGKRFSEVIKKRAFPYERIDHKTAAAL